MVNMYDVKRPGRDETLYKINTIKLLEVTLRVIQLH